MFAVHILFSVSGIFHCNRSHFALFWLRMDFEHVVMDRSFDMGCRFSEAPHLTSTYKYDRSKGNSGPFQISRDHYI